MKKIILFSWLIISATGSQGFYLDEEYWGEHNYSSHRSLQKAVDEGLDVKGAKDVFSRTILHYAAQGTNEPNTIKLLVNTAGIDVNVRDYIGDTPLHDAVHRNKNSKIVSALIEVGAFINATDIHGNTPLHLTASFNNLVNAKLLIKAGAKVNLRNKKGRTPLYKAVVRTKNLAIIKALVAAGARINFKDKAGVSLLDEAKKNDNKEIYEYLAKMAKVSRIFGE